MRVLAGLQHVLLSFDQIKFVSFLQLHCNKYLYCLYCNEIFNVVLANNFETFKLGSLVKTYLYECSLKKVSI